MCRSPRASGARVYGCMKEQLGPLPITASDNCAPTATPPAPSATLLAAVLFHKCDSNNNCCGYSARAIIAPPRDVLIYHTAVPETDASTDMTSSPPVSTASDHCRAPAPPPIFMSRHCARITLLPDPSRRAHNVFTPTPLQTLRNPTALPMHSLPSPNS